MGAGATPERAPPLAIPQTLPDTLLARHDRLAKTKDIAQLAACIGRSFEFDLLSAVAERERHGRTD